MNVLHPRLIAQVTDPYEAVRTPHRFAEGLYRVVARHKPLPVWERPEEHYGACKNTCEEPTHPHGAVLTHVCAVCLYEDELGQLVNETYPCEEIQDIGLALGLCEEVDADDSE